MAKDAAAARLGRKGGLARAANLSAEEQSEIGRNAVAARWARYYAAHPEKRPAATPRAKAKPRRAAPGSGGSRKSR